MGVRPVWILLATACGFHPGGDATQDGDAPPAIDAPPEGDGPPAIDAPAIDAPAIDAPPIDAPPIDARPPCPIEYSVATNTGRYALRHIAMLHAVANADCNDDLAGRTHLATWETPAGFDPDLALLNPGNSAIVFVGASCTGLDCDRMTGWFWNTGPIVDASLWDVGEPNNTIVERVGVAVRDGGEWKLESLAPTETRPYICECEP